MFVPPEEPLPTPDAQAAAETATRARLVPWLEQRWLLGQAPGSPLIARRQPPRGGRARRARVTEPRDGRRETGAWTWHRVHPGYVEGT